MSRVKRKKSRKERRGRGKKGETEKGLVGGEGVDPEALTSKREKRSTILKKTLEEKAADKKERMNCK